MTGGGGGECGIVGEEGSSCFLPTVDDGRLLS